MNNEGIEMVQKKGKPKTKKSTKKNKKKTSATPKYPRHSVEKSLRIPRAILDQNAGKDCTDKDAAKFSKLSFAGPFRVELSSSIKYGFLERPKKGYVGITSLGKKVLRPQKLDEKLEGYRAAIMNAPEISSVYKHYRGENLPDTQFLNNSLMDKFGIPEDKLKEFTTLFLESLETAELIEKHGTKIRILDISADGIKKTEKSSEIKKLGKDIKIDENDTCFVIMPFIPPIGEYYSQIYEPAIEKAGLKSIRADDDIFATGKIINQIWNGINAARILVAELTDRNPNVFYELGLAHALNKPVVLVSSNQEDVPFDLHHIRVIYYDVKDPFWGEKLIEKVAENILSAIKNPEEALFPGILKNEQLNE